MSFVAVDERVTPETVIRVERMRKLGARNFAKAESYRWGSLRDALKHQRRLYGRARKLFLAANDLIRAEQRRRKIEL